MADTKNIYQRLLDVQTSLVAPRQAGGRFGKARSAEQILEALKPHLKSHGLLLTTSERIVERANGQRFYVECTATVTNIEKPEEFLSATAEAREGDEERGLDPSQVTGKTSSYAKKYALQHLFSIDDTKDADHAAPTEPTEVDQKPKSPVSTPENALARAKLDINEALKAQGYTAEVAKKAFITKVLKQSTIDTIEQAHEVMDALDNEKEEES